MGSWQSFLLTYIFGGVTFLPLLVLAVLLHAHLTLPTREEETDPIVRPGDDTAALEDLKKDGTKSWSTEIDVPAGYFAISREYTPMGINAKPIERSTPVGAATVAAPSPSVYQTMYRSIFERKPVAGTTGPSTAGVGSGENKSMSQRPKNAGNVFYVVIRHSHLMLFDDEEQAEVRHVISIAHHDISIHAGGGVIPEGELWIKRNAICLSPTGDSSNLTPDGQVAKPFYLFSENCSVKEDFYFALLRNKGKIPGASSDCAPIPKTFDNAHMISLVERLHQNEANIQYRWVNALIGRIFLGIYRTADIENYIREKLTKKIARVKRPAFLTNITIQKIDTGDSAPFFNNLKLRDLNIHGECVIEADVKYTGNFRIEVAATAKIDLGPRFKAREVNLVLAVVAKRIEGRGLMKIKSPPSNRCWISFQGMPKMDLAIEPIVSSRQITYTVILRQIENRIKEVVAETLVYPCWDDIPFFKTEHKNWRGGIFEGDDAVVNEPDVEGVLAQGGDVDSVERNDEKAEQLGDTRPIEKSMTMPISEKEPAVTGLFGRKIKGSDGASPAASTTSFESNKTAPMTGGLRSPHILSNATGPVVGTDSSHADLFKPSTSPPDTATSYMSALHSRSQVASPAETPGGSPGKTASIDAGLSENYPSLSLTSEEGDEERPADDGPTPPALGPSGRRNTTSSTEIDLSQDAPDSPVSAKGNYATGSLGRNFWLRRENSTASTATSSTAGSQKANNTLAAVSNAALQAKQWGWNAIQRQKEARKQSHDSSNQPVDLSQPMGRGQPLPPPGTPLPMPTNGTTKIAPMQVPKRKPLPSHSKRGSVSESIMGDSGEEQGSLPPPLPGRRRRGGSHESLVDEGAEESVLVIAAPPESEPGTPAAVDDTGADYAGHWDEDGGTGSNDDDRSSRRTFQTSQTDTAVGSSTTIPELSIENEKPPASTPPASTDNLATSEPVISSEQTAKTPQPAKATRRQSLKKKVPAATDSTPKPAKVADDEDDFSGWMDEEDLEESDEVSKTGGLKEAPTADPRDTPRAQAVQ